MGAAPKKSKLEFEIVKKIQSKFSARCVILPSPSVCYCILKSKFIFIKRAEVIN